MSRSTVVLIGVVAPLAGFAALAATTSDETPALDRELVELSTRFYELELGWDAATLALRASVAVGVAVAVAVLVVLLTRRLLSAALFWTLSIGGTVVLEPLLKMVVHRPGIGASSDEWSFPSGSAMASVAIALSAVLLLAGTQLQRRIAAAGAVLVLAQSIGVVALGWHYASDVVGGWLAGLAWVMALAVAFRRIGVHPASRMAP